MLTDKQIKFRTLWYFRSRLFRSLMSGRFRSTFKSIYANINHHYQLATIRSSFTFFGYDVRDYNDQELEKGLIEAGKAFAKTGLTVDEVALAFKQMKI